MTPTEHDLRDRSSQTFTFEMLGELLGGLAVDAETHRHSTVDLTDATQGQTLESTTN